jgi:hypothetical protein
MQEAGSSSLAGRPPSTKESTMVKVIESFGERMLQLVVPRTVASATAAAATRLDGHRR